MQKKKQQQIFKQPKIQISQYYNYTNNKEYFLGKTDSKVDQNSNSRPKTIRLPNSKIRLESLDEESTRNVQHVIKAVISKQIIKQKKAKCVQTYIKQFEADSYSCSISSNFSSSLDKIPTVIPSNNKIQTILKASPLRSKYSYLLSSSQKYSIGRAHLTLLKILRALDYTINFLVHNRNSKFCFFSDLKKHLYENSRMEVAFQHLQQLLFLDDRLFVLKWDINQKIKEYDLLIELCGNNIGEQRIQNTRNKIVKYLSEIHQDYLANKKQSKINSDGWVEDFNPNNFEIPQVSLPIHPYKLLNSPQSSSFQCNKLTYFQKIGKSNKHSSSTSLNSSQVASMIFAKQPNKCIAQKISVAILQKDNQLKAKPSQQKLFQIEKSILMAICREIMKIYLSKGVNHIYKASIISCLDKNLQYKAKQLCVGLQKIIHNNKVIFLKQLPTSDHNAVLQIHKENFSKIISHLSHQ